MFVGENWTETLDRGTTKWTMKIFFFCFLWILIYHRCPTFGKRLLFIEFKFINDDSINILGKYSANFRAETIY